MCNKNILVYFLCLFGSGAAALEKYCLTLLFSLNTVIYDVLKQSYTDCSSKAMVFQMSCRLTCTVIWPVTAVHFFVHFFPLDILIERLLSKKVIRNR